MTAQKTTMLIRINNPTTAITLEDTGDKRMRLTQTIRNGSEPDLNFAIMCSLMQAGVYVNHYISDIIYRIREQNTHLIGVWETWVDEEKIPALIRKEWIDTQDKFFKALNELIITELEEGRKQNA